jgi:hypothetical protein
MYRMQVKFKEKKITEIRFSKRSLCWSITQRTDRFEKYDFQIFSLILLCPAFLKISRRQRDGWSR